MICIIAHLPAYSLFLYLMVKNKLTILSNNAKEFDPTISQSLIRKPYQTHNAMPMIRAIGITTETEPESFSLITFISWGNILAEVSMLAARPTMVVWSMIYMSKRLATTKAIKNKPNQGTKLRPNPDGQESARQSPALCEGLL